MKVDFSYVRNVGKRPAGLLVTLFINWIVKPFSMALLAWAFFRVVFAQFLMPAEADQIHSRPHHPGGCALYGHGLCLEPSDKRRPCLYARAGVSKRLNHAVAVGR